MNWAEILTLALAAYAGVGVLFAIAFVTRGVSAIDPNAHHGPLGFRVLIFPASAALWPILLQKWLRCTRDNRVDTESTRSPEAADAS